MRTTKDSEHQLDSTWPAFLDKLDSDPEEAGDEFCVFGYRLLQVSPPLALAWFPARERKDAIQDVLLHCIEDNFDVLRSYKPEGQKFRAWFSKVAKNKLKDLLKKQKPGREVPFDTVPEPWSLGPEPRDPILARRMRACLDSMGNKCRVLLILFMDDFKPAEIAEVAGALLGQEPYSNVQASNDLRFCKRRYAGMLKASGLKGP
jgi:RNA polymerase sigma factor (sigma-70 family)